MKPRKKFVTLKEFIAIFIVCFFMLGFAVVHYIDQDSFKKGQDDVLKKLKAQTRLMNIKIGKGIYKFLCVPAKKAAKNGK